MEITRENTGELSATVKIAISPADYSESVNKVLKDYQRKANVPGFRPGHVPFGMIKKLYGSAVFADEVNKLVSEALTNYIKEEKLDVLGQPLPNMELTQTFDWKDEKEISFFFDLGLSPDFNLVLDDSVGIDYYKIKVSDELLDKYITDLRQRHGEMGNAEIAGEKDVVSGEFTELDADGNVLENGISNFSKLMIDTLKNDETKKRFIGAKVGDQLDFNPAADLDNTTEIATLLGVEKEEAVDLKSDFRLTISEITTMIPAELNETFYAKIYPDQGVDNASDFREKIRAESENSFTGDSDHYFMHLVQDKLMEISSMSLPDAFMKRWLLESNEGKIAPEDLEKDYDKYSKSMKWQLIENRIVKDFDLKVDEDEIKGYIKDRYLPGWRTMSLPDDLTNRLENLADTFLQNKHDEVRHIIDGIIDHKITILVKSKVRLIEKEITYEEFVKLDAERH